MNICVNKHPLQIEASVSNGYDNKSLGGILLLCSSRRIIEVDFQLDTLPTCPQVHNAITSVSLGYHIIEWVLHPTLKSNCLLP